MTSLRSVINLICASVQVSSKKVTLKQYFIQNEPYTKCCVPWFY